MRFWPALVLFSMGLLSLCQAAEAPAPDLAPLVKQLASEEFSARDQAEGELLKLGKPALAALQKARAEAQDEEARMRLSRVIDALTVPLEMSIVLDGEAKAGQPVHFKVMLKNISEREVLVVPALDGSTTARRYPCYSRLVEPAPGPAVQFGFCKFMNSLTAADFKALKPGESCEVCGPNTFGSDLSDWHAPAGKYTVSFACDFSAPELAKWRGTAVADDGEGNVLLQRQLDRVPKLKLSARLEVTVKP